MLILEKFPKMDTLTDLQTLVLGREGPCPMKDTVLLTGPDIQSCILRLCH